MINSIINGISEAIFNEFTEEYEIYTEKIKQDLKEPCFFITLLNHNSRLFLDKRYYNESLFSIQYFPSSNEIETECNKIAQKLIDCLEWITVDADLIRGTNFYYEVVDDVLNFQVSYNLFVTKKIKNTELMEDCTVNTDI